MNRSLVDSAFESLIKQMVYFDEKDSKLLEKYFPKHDRERKEIEQLMNSYRERLERIIREFNMDVLQSVVLIGSQVRVMNEQDGFEESYTIVLPEHSNVDQYLISFLSPIGRELLLSNKGEIITAETPSGSIELIIVDVRFLVY